MKTYKLILTLLAGVLLASSAPAQVNINLSGAVAFRSTAYKAIRAIFNNPTNGFLVNQNPSSALSGVASSNLLTWTGYITNLYGGQLVTVRANYNGAVAGIQDLVQNRDVVYYSSSTPGSATLITNKSDIAFSSIFQGATEFTTPDLNDAQFGATPINFVKSTLGTAGITNITTHQLKTLIANGSVPAWFLTGNTNDTHTIYFINRDPTAGQRVTVLLESLFTGSPSSFFWTNNTAGWVPDTTGRTAGQITTHLNTFSNAISYLISEDSYNVNSGLNVLTYNGNRAYRGTFSNVTTNDFSPVINGQYSLWVYEHLATRTTALAQITNFRTALINAIGNELLVSSFSIPLDRLKVERASDGAPVAPK